MAHSQTCATSLNFCVCVSWHGARDTTRARPGDCRLRSWCTNAQPVRHCATRQPSQPFTRPHRHTYPSATAHFAPNHSARCWAANSCCANAGCGDCLTSGTEHGNTSTFLLPSYWTLTAVTSSTLAGARGEPCEGTFCALQMLEEFSSPASPFVNTLQAVARYAHSLSQRGCGLTVIPGIIETARWVLRRIGAPPLLASCPLLDGLQREANERRGVQVRQLREAVPLPLRLVEAMEMLVTSSIASHPHLAIACWQTLLWYTAR